MTVNRRLEPRVRPGIHLTAPTNWIIAVGLARDLDGAVTLDVIDVVDSVTDARLATWLPRRDGPITLDVFIDGAIIEAFADGAALATRIDRRALPVDRLDLVEWTGRTAFSELVTTTLEPAATITDG